MGGQCTAKEFTQNPLSSIPNTSPSEPASVEDYLQDDVQDDFSLNPSSESDLEDSDNKPSTSRQLYTSRSHTHLPPHTATTLFPPFYNRPPTPLPPSPSLTSLLRPSFSTQTSRPTTPDSSDVDLPAATGTATNGTNTPTSTTTNLASITKSARHAPMVPRASPKVPTYEYYGFALYLASSAAFLMYILWAYVPSPLLHQMGIHYYPNRWWALAVPAWMVVFVVYIYVALASYNTRYLTLPLSSCENLADECAQVAVIDRRTGKIARDRLVGKSKWHENDKDGKGQSSSISANQFSASEDVDWKRLWSTGTDAVMDVPIGGVCEILYGRSREPAG
ncbi:PIG-P-domain-containing protein [Lindgomyces ingoldianus]|uniref:PIG-P-domain-containing protein n=1 Tax=Lindgomyces ingoldianus TaxID=673940 RepID=A0ACB6R635_9PLEO|nr:PIG-P-domain-containing protein [Lindgomyces ingoldianus]KAF2474250.1 PIG-P-domain-containing protein [Lindgomyces ingoldianus]